MPSFDALVVGGGIVGLSVAYHLVEEGAHTLLLDRSDPGRATDAGAGILASDTNVRDSDTWLGFAAAATAYYPDLIERLGAASAGETSYAQRGLLLVACSKEEERVFARARKRIFERRDRRGAPTPEDLCEISPSEARTLFPPLGEVRGAILARRAARVDGRLLAAALRRAAVARGLVLREESVAAIAFDGDAAVGVTVDGAPGAVHDARSVVLAAGSWSRAFEAQLGVSIPVEPQRGQIVHLGLPGVETDAWPMIAGFRDHYMVAWPDARVAVGATRETSSGHATSTTAAGVREVLDEALRVAPGLQAAEILDVRVGLRPLTADGLPVLGPVPGKRNLFLATGHGPTGLTLGPLSGKVVAELALGRPCSVEIGAFDVARFAR